MSNTHRATPSPMRLGRVLPSMMAILSMLVLHYEYQTVVKTRELAVLIARWDRNVHRLPIEPRFSAKYGRHTASCIARCRISPTLRDVLRRGKVTLPRISSSPAQLCSHQSFLRQPQTPHMTL